MNEFFKGTWTLALAKVHIVLYKKIKNKSVIKYSRKQANRDKEPQVDQEHIFRMV